MSEFITHLKTLLSDIATFAHSGSETRLRRYQEEVARAVVDSVVHQRGLTFVVIFPRQSGKNELQAQIEAYLLMLYSTLEAEIVKVSPTWKPQSLNAMRRLERVLAKNLLTRAFWCKQSGYIYCVASARIFFLSASPSANIVGATASTLLECDEAQDVLISKWDREVNPMAASTNATRIFWGTAWTSHTLLAREKRLALEAEKRDGIRRLFTLNADDVAAEVPAYGRFVAGEIARLGRSHPFIRTQFFSEEIDAEGGMFPPERQALMQGERPWQPTPVPGAVYAFLIDVAGEDEAASANPLEDGETPLANPGRDATALTIVEIDAASLADPLLHAPTYRVAHRKLWTGVRHVHLYGWLKALAESWQPRWLVIDATGVGAGLASFLASHFGSAVIPFTFNSASKSKLGWTFLAVIESGRFKDYAATHADGGLRALFYQQLSAIQMNILPGPERRMTWGAPQGARCPDSGELLHDDLALSAALVGALEEQPWGAAHSALIRGDDPLGGMSDAY